MTQNGVSPGIIRIPLAKADHGLDEDGWIDIKKRLSARDLLALVKARQAAPDGSILVDAGEMVGHAIIGWSLCLDGEQVSFDRERLLDLLPASVYITVTLEVGRRNPFQVVSQQP